MTLFNPPIAPPVHIEPIPELTRAYRLTTDHAKRTRFAHDNPIYSVLVDVWCPSDSSMACFTSGDEEDFLEGTCHECEYYCTTMEISVDYVRGDNGEDFTPAGDVTCYSPCSCESDGIGSVEFPCYAGHDGPEAEEVEDSVDLSYMKYSIWVDPSTGDKVRDGACQQGITFNGRQALVTFEQECLNVFQSDRFICWGDNQEGRNLMDIEMRFTASPANEDLLPLDQHQNYAYEINENLKDEITHPFPGVYKTVLVDKQPMAVIWASARHHTYAFVIMGSCGARIDSGVAHVLARFYPKVAITPDIVCDVWATDATATGRLLFVQDGAIHQFIGQFDNNFNLKPCESLTQQSLDVAEPVNS